MPGMQGCAPEPVLCLMPEASHKGPGWVRGNHRDGGRPVPRGNPRRQQKKPARGPGARGRVRRGGEGKEWGRVGRGEEYGGGGMGTSRWENMGTGEVGEYGEVLHFFNLTMRCSPRCSRCCYPCPLCPPPQHYTRPSPRPQARHPQYYCVFFRARKIVLFCVLLCTLLQALLDLATAISANGGY